MKKMLILLVFIGYSVAGFGQQDSTFTIEGTVWDEETGDFLEKATVYLIKDEIKIDSTFSNENGEYRFEVEENGCYHLRCELVDYLAQGTDKCYSYAGRIQKHNFYLSVYRFYEVPLFNKIPIQIFISDEEENIVPTAQLSIFYENEDTIIHNIENGMITIDYKRGKILNLEVSKKDFITVKNKYFKNANSGGCIPYFVTKSELEKIILEQQIIQPYQKIYITLIQKD